MVYTSRIRGNADRRPQAFWGAFIPAAINFVGGLITSSQQAKAQKRALEEQQRLAQQQLNISNQNQLASTLNNYASAQQSYDDKDYNLKYRIGGVKRLGGRNIMITDGGNAKRIGNNTYLLRGGSHEDINETGQTGIGINVGGNEIEAEGGEVAQRKGNSLRIYSAQPILGGMSPAQAIMRGYNKDKVFNAQQSFKKRNGLEDDGGKAEWGDFFPLFGKRKPVKSTGRYSRQGDFIYDNKTKKRTISQLPLGLTYPEYVLLSGGRQMEFNRLKEAAQPIRKAITGKGFNLSKEYPDLKSGVIEYLKQFNGLLNPIMRYGGLTSKDRGSSKHPYPSVSSKDFAGGNRSYPIPTKADAIDALRLAGLHGRSDVKAKVYSRYPELRKKAEIGTIVPGGIPGTDSYKQRMYSGYNVSPADLLNLLEYLDRAAGYVDEDGNSRYITGIAPSPGIVSRAKILKGVQEANRVAQAARASQSAQRTSYTVKQAKDFYRDLGINIPVGRSRIYNPTFRSSEIAERVKESNNAFNIYSNNTHLPKGIRLTPTDKSSIGRTAARVINPREAEIVRMGIPIGESAKNMTNGANPFLYTPRNSNEVLEGLNRVIRSAGQKVKGFGNKVANPNTYRTRTGFEERYNPNIGAYEQYNTYKLKPWVKGAARSAGVASAMGIGVGLAKINSKNENTKAQLDAHGKPISQYIARPQAPAKQPSKTQIKKGVPQKNNTVPSRVNTTPQYKGNVTKGNYQLHDGETRTINGIKYTRRGNTIINHKTNVGYIYDKNGNYTGQADYSKVGNFNQAFDAARAAGRNQFIYRAGKYQNYSTNKETDAKKEALNRRVGARRIAKKIGGLTNPPVGSRKKYLPGGTANPWDEYRFTNYLTPNTWNERYGISNVPDYGGTAPWQVSNKYAVNAPYPITEYDLPITTITAKKDTFNDEMSRRMRAGVQNLKDDSDSKTTVPYLGKQSSFSPKVQDYIGLGVDTLAALGSGMFTRSAYNKMNFDYALPNYVDESPVAFDTTYHNEAQRANVERNRLNSRSLITGNTSSAQTALGRMQQTDTDAMMETNKLLDEKTNKEVELRNQNAANEQQVRARNAAARNQYYQSVAQIKNAALEAKNNMELARAQSIGADLSGLSQAWTNFAGSVENRYDARQNEIAAISSANSPSVVKNAISLGYNLSPEVLANLYKSSKNDELRNAILGRLSPYERKRYGIE